MENNAPPFLEASSDEQRSFKQLMAQHMDTVYAYALRRLHDPGLSREITIAAFTNAWFARIPTADVALLLRQARTQVTQRRSTALSLQAEPRRLELMATEEAGPDLLAATLAVLRSSPETDAELLMLQSWEQLDDETVARSLDLSVRDLADRSENARSLFDAQGAATGAGTHLLAALASVEPLSPSDRSVIRQSVMARIAESPEEDWAEATSRVITAQVVPDPLSGGLPLMLVVIALIIFVGTMVLALLLARSTTQCVHGPTGTPMPAEFCADRP